MHSKDDNMVMMINNEADEVKSFLIHLKIDIKIICNQ